MDSWDPRLTILQADAYLVSILGHGGKGKIDLCPLCSPKQRVPNTEGIENQTGDINKGSWWRDIMESQVHFKKTDATQAINDKIN